MEESIMVYELKKKFHSNNFGARAYSKIQTQPKCGNDRNLSIGGGDLKEIIGSL